MSYQNQTLLSTSKKSFGYSIWVSVPTGHALLDAPQVGYCTLNPSPLFLSPNLFYGLFSNALIHSLYLLKTLLDFLFLGANWVGIFFKLTFLIFPFLSIGTNIPHVGTRECSFCSNLYPWLASAVENRHLTIYSSYHLGIKDQGDYVFYFFPHYNTFSVSFPRNISARNAIYPLDILSLSFFVSFLSSFFSSSPFPSSFPFFFSLLFFSFSF